MDGYIWNNSNSKPTITSTLITIPMDPGTVPDTIYVRVCESASQETTSTCSSGTQYVTVTAAVPSVSSLSPPTMTAGSGTQTLTIYGSNFVAGNEVQVEYTGSGGWINALNNPPTIVTSGQMTIPINPGSVPDTIYVRVCESASQETTSTCSSGTQYATVQ